MSYPGPKTKAGVSTYIRCHAKDQRIDGRLCAYSDDGRNKRSGVLGLSWNGRENPKDLDRTHLCPKTTLKGACPTGFRRPDVLRVVNVPHGACVYHKKDGAVAGFGREACQRKAVAKKKMTTVQAVKKKKAPKKP
jgi:hypothetical protein